MFTSMMVVYCCVCHKKQMPVHVWPLLVLPVHVISGHDGSTRLQIDAAVHAGGDKCDLTCMSSMVLMRFVLLVCF